MTDWFKLLGSSSFAGLAVGCVAIGWGIPAALAVIIASLFGLGVGALMCS